MTKNKIVQRFKRIGKTHGVHFDTTFLESYKILSNNIALVKVIWETQNDMIHAVAFVRSVYDLPMDYVAKKELRIVKSFASPEEATLWCDLQDYQIVAFSKLFRDTEKQRKARYECP